LAVFRALGDSTRYSIYCEIARSSSPRSTADLAKALGLHPNTVRPHLERLREAGLLEVERKSRGTVGRPQHRYQVAAKPVLPDPDSPAHRILSDMLVRLASGMRPSSDDVVKVGRRQGGVDAATIADVRSRPCVQALEAELVRLGFDPAMAGEGAEITFTFMRCPYRELAEAHPEVVCELHRGMVEGLVEGRGGARVARFATLADNQPCRVELAVG
jgi:predicted ArsR family transcriptional regulator